MLKQKTLKDSFSLSGKGLHTGLDLTVTFNPGAAGRKKQNRINLSNTLFCPVLRSVTYC